MLSLQQILPYWMHGKGKKYANSDWPDKKVSFLRMLSFERIDPSKVSNESSIRGSIEARKKETWNYF